MNTRDTRDWRSLVFLAVLMSHVAIVFVGIRSAQLVISTPSGANEPLIVSFFDEATPPPAEVAAPPMPISSAHPVARESVRPEPPPPRIDWEYEAEVAAKNGVASAEREKAYRDLSALSPEQLGGAMRNHMEPAPPGIAWQHPRFEFDRHSGLPIFWINDHCVLVTLMVFCAIGTIEPNGDLFKHMRDARDH